jgi:tRNA dimethylallyltransferase
MTNEALLPAVLLMGPTASGKTALAVKLAQLLDGEIISVDSALVYKGMDIGTAKPTLSEREGVTHHLIDILDPSEFYSTGQFRTQALALMAEMSARGKVPILVGGTMLYFRALTQGLAELPPANPEIRQRLDMELAQLGQAVLHKRLESIDKAAALRIHPNDPQRVQRALEVYEITGKPLSTFFEKTDNALPYHCHKFVIAPEKRADLHQRIAMRFEQMLKNGFLEEVEQLVQRGDLHDKLPSMRAVGYQEAWRYFQGDYDLNTMTQKAIIATRQLAKRQFTWLRREEQAHTFTTEQKDVLIKMTDMIKNNS